MGPQEFVILLESSCDRGLWLRSGLTRICDLAGDTSDRGLWLHVRPTIFLAPDRAQFF